MHTYHTIIIGAGPIGLELAASLKHAGVDYLQLDAGQVGHTISWYPRQARFFSSPERIAIAGLPLNTDDQTKATGEQYLAYLRGVVEHFDLAVNTYEPVIDIQRSDDAFTVTTEKTTYRATHVVLAIGDMHRPRMLDIPGEDLPHVSHYFVEPHRYFRKKLLIVGGRNSAVEAALRCYHSGAQVAISYRHENFDKQSVKYWLYPELKSLIKAKRIAFYPQTTPTAIDGNHITLQHIDGNEPQTIAADFVLLLTGYEMDATLLQRAGVELEGENRSPKYDPLTMQTNVVGLFVAGTAAAGTQNRFRLFIENCHIHAARITNALTGSPPPQHLINAKIRDFDLPES